MLTHHTGQPWEEIFRKTLAEKFRLIDSGRTACDYYEESLKNKLIEKKCTVDDLSRWTTEADRLNLQKDPLFENIKQASTHQEKRTAVYALQQRFFEEGIEQFKCVELRVCLENIKKVITSLKKQYEQEWGGEIDNFLGQVDQVLGEENEPVSYKDSILMAFIFGELTTIVYYPDFQNVPDELKKTWVNYLFTMKFEDFGNDFIKEFKRRNSCEPDLERSVIGFFIKMIDIKEICSVLLADKPHSFIWPCFDSLDCNFFIAASMFRILPAGLLAVPAAFHDGILMSPNFFFVHDFIHAESIRSEYLMEENNLSMEEEGITQKVLKKVELLNNKHPRFIKAMELLLFYHFHEGCNSIESLELKGYSGPQESRQFFFSFADQVMRGHFDACVNKDELIEASVLLRKAFPPVESNHWPLPDEVPKITIYQSKYLNNIVEQEHRFVKRLTRPMMPFNACYSARTTRAGIEFSHRLRKGQYPGSGSIAPWEYFYSLAG